MCAQLLDIDTVGIYDSFFELGGHSLLATQFAAQIKDKLYVEVPLRVLFERPTVVELAKYIDSSESGQAAEVADLLDQVSQMSEEDVLALLGEQTESDLSIELVGSAGSAGSAVAGRSTDDE
jgi:hypothetical protein